AKYFYITPGICPSLSTMKAIMECARGKMLTMQSLFSLECSLRHWTTSHILWEGGGWAPLII
ncbi:hypothetical protein Celaphus_00012444, partial [Cervus elaphus hippelaphus]